MSMFNNSMIHGYVFSRAQTHDEKENVHLMMGTFYMEPSYDQEERSPSEK